MNAEKPNGKVLPMGRRERRDAARRGGIPVEVLSLIEIVASGLPMVSRQMLNSERLASCTRIWVTNQAAVAVCPGYDDFLVWLNVQTKGAMTVKTTAKAVDDFSRNVLPIINAHRTANNLVDEQINAANVEWLLSTCNKVRDENLSLEAELPPRPRWDDMPGYAATYDAYEAALAALTEFLARHDAVPDLV
jgi:hypothetical protein